MSKSSNLVLGLLAGGAIGATLGILFAPDKGINTRQKLVDEALSAKADLSEKAHEVKDKVASQAKQKKDSLDSQLESILNNASYKADDIITSLEQKLAILKARNKQFQKETSNKTNS
ncbi:YtxH domain-containing protein [Tamlana fucoidanivorans]|uniref:YtxH domain-containing protein n=1 Tax=Allotamlana fucoidanivorans TaxID=2583814 RepID=A0A5C4SN28_9FLAO|nr:YtxH domain-containing protein [Tamlana fucoidanivorans]TNJ45395.1 YtxH domain-containing protein [Tamlana fucoidanivorans]